MKIVTIKGLWLLYWRTKFHIDISNRLWFIGVSNVKNRTHTHTRTHAHTYTSWRQLKITFLDVLEYSEYSDTNISKFFFPRKHSFLSEEAKIVISKKLVNFTLFRDAAREKGKWMIFIIMKCDITEVFNHNIWINYVDYINCRWKAPKTLFYKKKKKWAPST